MDHDDTYNMELLYLEASRRKDICSLLQCDVNGLSSNEARRRLALFGPNKLPFRTQNTVMHIFRSLFGPLGFAAVLSSALPIHVGWPAFLLLFFNLILFSALAHTAERRSSKKMRGLSDALDDNSRARVKRDGLWMDVSATSLVPGDLICLRIGDTTPADCRVCKPGSALFSKCSFAEYASKYETEGEYCLTGSICMDGQVECVVVATGQNTTACTVSPSRIRIKWAGIMQASTTVRFVGICVILMTFALIINAIVLHAGLNYSFRRGWSNLLVILISSLPVAAPAVLSVILSVGIDQLARHKVIINRIETIEDLAGIDVLCVDKSSLDTGHLTLLSEHIYSYNSYSADDVLRLASYVVSRDNLPSTPLAQYHVDQAILQASGGANKAHAALDVQQLMPYNQMDRFAQITYRNARLGSTSRVIHGRVSAVVEMCSRTYSRNTEELYGRIEKDVDECVSRGFTLSAVAYEEVINEDSGEGKGPEFVGLLPFFSLPYQDTFQSISDLRSLHVNIKMMTTDEPLWVAKEFGRRAGLGQNIHPARVLRSSLDNTPSMDLVLRADGFTLAFNDDVAKMIEWLQCAGRSCAMTGRVISDVWRFRDNDIGIAVSDATEVARHLADLVLVDPGISGVGPAIQECRQTLCRMRNYSIYACSNVIFLTVCFSILAFAYQVDFPLFTAALLLTLNEGVALAAAFDRIDYSSCSRDTGRLRDVLPYSISFGLYLALSTVILVVAVRETSFFHDRFGLNLGTPSQIHAAVFLQMSQMSQSSHFIIRSYEWPASIRCLPYALLGAFTISQVISSVIAVFARWDFASIDPVSSGWVGIIWIWNIIWIIPLFGMKRFIDKFQKRMAFAYKWPIALKAYDLVFFLSTWNWLYPSPTPFIKRKYGFGGMSKLTLHNMTYGCDVQVRRAAKVLRGTTSRDDLIPVE